jgi:DNA-binding CsgD family transcriptional regulator
VRCAEAHLSLSQREGDVPRMVGLGWTNKEIGHVLQIAESTVKTHVSAILGKLGAQTRTQAALHAVRLGLVSTDELGAAACDSVEIRPSTTARTAGSGRWTPSITRPAG